MVLPLDGPSGITMSLSWDWPTCPSPIALPISPEVSREQACIFCSAGSTLETNENIMTKKTMKKSFFMMPSLWGFYR
jgi:hypothetical protein